MIVSDSKRFIYARIPKTASTSVSAALEPYRRKADRSLAGRIVRQFAPATTRAPFVNFRAHSHWGLQAAREVLGEADFAQRHKFSVVRHPFARTRSLFAHIMRHQGEAAFQEVYRSLYALYEQRAADDLGPFVDWLSDNPLPPQSALLVDYDGQLLANDIIRVECLDTEIPPLFAKLGIEATIPRLNIGHNLTQSQYSPAQSAILQDLFAVDFQTFGYEPDVLQPVRPPLNQTAPISAVIGTHLKTDGGALHFSPWNIHAA